MNKVCLNNIIKEKNKVKYEFEISGYWKKFFNLNEEYFIEYDREIEKVPDSILAIPFVSTFIPISWIFNAEIKVKSLDKDFFESMKELKKSYNKMYDFEFKGSLICNENIDCKYENGNNVACFFSGGIDAMSTLITHYEENPLLINIQGADIKVYDNQVLDKVKEKLDLLSNQLNREITYIKTSFRELFKYRKIDIFVKYKFKTTYWYGFQHGLSIISHAAPTAYLYNLKTIYIASSNCPEDGDVRCASDPTTDNCVKLAKTNIIHDEYGVKRGDKIKNIAEYMKKNNLKLKLKVCFDETKSENCCNCEKCYRTIAEIEVNGYSPESFGFNIVGDIHKKMQKDFENKILLYNTRYDWNRIKEEAFENKEYSQENYKWIYDYDFFHDKNAFIKMIKKYYNAILKIIKDVNRSK